MSTRKEQEGSQTTGTIEHDMLMLVVSLRDPFQLDNAVKQFRSVTPKIVRSILERNMPSIISALETLLDPLYPNTLDIESKADILCSPLYLQGRLDQLTDFLKAASGRAILDSMIEPPRNKK